MMLKEKLGEQALALSHTLKAKLGEQASVLGEHLHHVYNLFGTLQVLWIVPTPKFINHFDAHSCTCMQVNRAV